MAKARTRVQVRLKLSAATKARIDQQVDERGYRDASAYVDAVVAKDCGVPTITSLGQLDGFIAEAIASGPPRAMTARDWARLRRASQGVTGAGGARREQTRQGRRSA